MFVEAGEHEDDMIPGYIVPSEKRLHICYAGGVNTILMMETTRL